MYLKGLFPSLTDSSLTDDLKKTYTQLLSKAAILNRKVNQKKYSVKVIDYLDQLSSGQIYRIWINKKMQIDVSFFMRTFVKEVRAPWYRPGRTISEFSDHMVYRFSFIENDQIRDSVSIPPAQSELYSLVGILYLSCRRRIEEIEAAVQKKRERALKRNLDDQRNYISNFLKKIA